MKIKIIDDIYTEVIVGKLQPAISEDVRAVANRLLDKHFPAEVYTHSFSNKQNFYYNKRLECVIKISWQHWYQSEISFEQPELVQNDDFPEAYDLFGKTNCQNYFAVVATYPDRKSPGRQRSIMVERNNCGLNDLFDGVMEETFERLKDKLTTIEKI